MAEFLILDSSPTYNAISGRGTLKEIRYVVCTYHLKLKFPTPHGVGEVKGSQAKAMSYVCGIIRRLKPTNVMMVESSPQPEEEKLEIDMLDPRDVEKKGRGSHLKG